MICILKQINAISIKSLESKDYRQQLACGLGRLSDSVSPENSHTSDINQVLSVVAIQLEHIEAGVDEE